VSKHDTHFFNTFSLVIGLLVAVAVVLFAFARVVAARTQVAEVYADPLYQAGVEDRIKPLVRVAIAGRDNTGLVMQGLAVEGGIALAVPADGAALYDSVCKTCHGTGLVGSPKLADKGNWAPRLRQGKATLYQHALQGFTGTAGTMPMKGGRTDLTDELIKQGVDYMVSQVQ
jgi:cytochrome c5